MRRNGIGFKANFRYCTATGGTMIGLAAGAYVTMLSTRRAGGYPAVRETPALGVNSVTLCGRDRGRCAWRTYHRARAAAHGAAARPRAGHGRRGI